MKRSEKINMLNDIAAGVTSLIKTRSKTFRISKDSKIFIEIEGKEKEITEEKFRKLNGTFDIVVVELPEVPEGVKGFIEQRTYEIEDINGILIVTHSQELYDEIKRIKERIE